MIKNVTAENVFSPINAGKHQQKILSDYCEKLRRADTHALGFVPFSAFTEAMMRNRMVIEMENEEPCGFLIFSIVGERIKILMIAIQPDCRRIFHATNLLSGMLTLLDTQGTTYIQLRCAEDLESNNFWQCCGFKLITQVDGGLLRSAVVRPRAGTKEEQILRALGKETLMKIKRKTCRYRRINVYRLNIERSINWAGHDRIYKVRSFSTGGG